MICTNDDRFYQMCRALRSHGMTRELTDKDMRQQYIDEHPDLNPDFIFMGPAHNFRSNEINAVLGLSQLKKLDDNNKIRVKNFEYFIKGLNKEKYFTDFKIDGQCNYAFIVVMKDRDFNLRDEIEQKLRDNGIEFRRGLSGGGNQLRQPYFKNKKIDFEKFKNIEHIHNFSWYVGNYPSLEREKIDRLLEVLNES
jgi:CDP-6-deoxy-D-xylo-4-hexulose-3-dehydrase